MRQGCRAFKSGVLLHNDCLVNAHQEKSRVTLNTTPFVLRTDRPLFHKKQSERQP